jgi:hypothetical protein
MSVVNLRIIEPENDRNYIGTGNVRLRGEVLSSGHGTLFFKWYSNLVQTPLGDSLDFTTTLPPASVGSQVVILSAKDVVGDSAADLQNVQHAGMAGGPPDIAPAPCLIHVLLADMREPSTAGPPPILSKANATLSAQAPSQWQNDQFQAVNQVQYLWRFEPSGSPAGRAAADFVPPLASLAFDGSGAVPVLRYRGPLPAALGTGNYVLTLRVRKMNDPAVGHNVSRNIVLTV